MKCQSISFFEGGISKNSTFLVVMSLKLEFFFFYKWGFLKKLAIQPFLMIFTRTTITV